MKGFIRYTHDKNGKYRNLTEWNSPETGCMDTSYVHMLDSRKPMHIADIMDTIREYNKVNDPLFCDDVEYVSYVLIQLISIDMVRVVDIDTPYARNNIYKARYEECIAGNHNFIKVEGYDYLVCKYCQEVK